MSSRHQNYLDIWNWEKLLQVSEFRYFMNQNFTACCPRLLIVRVEKGKGEILRRTYNFGMELPHFHSHGTRMEIPSEWDFRNELCAKFKQITTEQRFQSKLQGHT